MLLGHGSLLHCIFTGLSREHLVTIYVKRQQGEHLPKEWCVQEGTKPSLVAKHVPVHAVRRGTVCRLYCDGTAQVFIELEATSQMTFLG